jgi:replication factor C subunit 2/4
MQSAQRLSASTDPPTPITAAEIQEIAGVVPDAVIERFARTLGVDVGMDVDGEVKPLKGFDGIRASVKHLVREGYSASQVLSQVFPLTSSVVAHDPDLIV